MVPHSREFLRDVWRGAEPQESGTLLTMVSPLPWPPGKWESEVLWVGVGGVALSPPAWVAHLLGVLLMCLSFPTSP